MTGLFTRLTQRALGLASPLEPLRSPALAVETLAIPDATTPASADADVPEAVAEPEFTAQRHPTLVAPSAANTPVDDPQQESIADVPASRRTAVEPTGRARTSEHVARDRPAHRRGDPQTPTTESARTEAQPVRTASHDDTATQRDTRANRVTAEASAVHPLSAEPRTSAAPGPVRHSQRVGATAAPSVQLAKPRGTPARYDAIDSTTRMEPAPTVKVTIGRIEVRAVHEPVAPPPRRPTQPDRTLSLADYLAQRRRGER